MSRIIVPAVLLIVAFGVGAGYAYGTAFEKEITVERLYQRTESSGGGDTPVRVSHVYMVADSEGNSYAVRDSWWYWRFRSTDEWNEMDEGGTYRVKGYGWRVGFLSMYPTIYEAQP